MSTKTLKPPILPAGAAPVAASLGTETIKNMVNDALISAGTANKDSIQTRALRALSGLIGDDWGNRFHPEDVQAAVRHLHGTDAAGADAFLSNIEPWLESKAVGRITNPSGIMPGAIADAVSVLPNEGVGVVAEHLELANRAGVDEVISAAAKYDHKKVVAEKTALAMQNGTWQRVKSFANDKKNKFFDGLQGADEHGSVWAFLKFYGVYMGAATTVGLAASAVMDVFGVIHDQMHKKEGQPVTLGPDGKPLPQQPPQHTISGAAAKAALAVGAGVGTYLLGAHNPKRDL